MEHDPTTLEIDRIRIELPVPEDAEQIADVQDANWLAVYPNAEYGITHEEIADRIRNRRQRLVGNWRKDIETNGDGKQTFVAKDGNGQVIGFCLGVKGEGEHQIGAAYVLPQAHGKGIGKRLVKEVIAWLPDDKPIILSVIKYNADAIGFYKKMGFVEMGDDAIEDTILLASGRRIPTVRMVRPSAA